MRYVKTAEEIARIQSIYSRSHELGVRMLTVQFETSAEAVGAVLPPPLEPAPECVGVAWVGEVGNSSSVGPYVISGVSVRARYGDLVGNYALTIPVSTPEALIFGREMYGEPRKLAKLIFEEQDEHVWGSAERSEIRFLSMRGRCSEPARTGRQETSRFAFKYLLRSDGSGFDSPPQLVHISREFTNTVARRGRGELVFRDSSHEPVIDLPVNQVIDAVYTEGQGYTSSRTLCQVDPDVFLPYAFGKLDCFEVIAEGTILHGQAARRTRDGKGQWRRIA